MTDRFLEEDILGTILAHGKTAFFIANRFLEPDDFHEPLRFIAGTIWKMYAEGKFVDSTTVILEMIADRTLKALPEEEITVSALLGGSKPVPEPFESLCYAFSMERSKAILKSEIRQIAVSNDLTVDNLNKALHEFAQKGRSGRFSGKKFSQMAEIRGNSIGEDDPGLSTGFNSLDFFLDGLRPGEMTILAARTGEGKSTLAMNIAVNVAKMGKSVLFFNVEMKDMALFDRALASEAGVNMQKSRQGRLSKEECDRLADTLPILHKLPIEIIEASGIEPETFPSEVSRRGSVDLVVVDYIQALRVPAKLADKPRHMQVGRASWTIKHDLALEMSIPVLTVGQLRRPDREYMHLHPDLADLRESGDLEQDADNVVFISHKRIRESPDLRTIVIAKNRTGRTGQVEMRFKRDHNRFEDLYASLRFNEVTEP